MNNDCAPCCQQGPGNFHLPAFFVLSLPGTFCAGGSIPISRRSTKVHIYMCSSSSGGSFAICIYPCCAVPMQQKKTYIRIPGITGNKRIIHHDNWAGHHMPSIDLWCSASYLFFFWVSFFQFSLTCSDVFCIFLYSRRDALDATCSFPRTPTCRKSSRSFLFSLILSDRGRSWVPFCLNPSAQMHNCGFVYIDHRCEDRKKDKELLNGSWLTLLEHPNDHPPKTNHCKERHLKIPILSRDLKL